MGKWINGISFFKIHEFLLNLHQNQWVRSCISDSFSSSIDEILIIKSESFFPCSHMNLRFDQVK